jgi:hypothetical protein
MMHGLYLRSRSVLLCAAACCALAAEAPQLGVQALGSWPTGSMRSRFASDTGYGLGVFATWETGPGKAVRLAYDGIWYPTEKNAAPIPGVPLASLASPGSERDHRSHSLTAQYLYYPATDIEGFYYKVGLGAMNYLTKVKSTLTYPASPNVDVTTLEESGTKLACLAGLGYDFNAKWGVMAQYSFITVNNHTLASVQTGISCRF